ncbi:MAG: hypothetical protein FWG34_05110 [Oscillospiraceae bacterium]|nr:hypothetical protein [Oscillospiraceae bacterium]
MKPKKITMNFAALLAAVFVLAAFAGCKKGDKSANLFKEGELGDFWDLQPDDAEIVPAPQGAGENEGDEVITDDESLNMDSVRKLAHRQISPFEFMENYPGTVRGENPRVYLNALPNDYVIRIEYEGENIILASLDDHRLGMSLDLLGDKSLDMFLLEREP